MQRNRWTHDEELQAICTSIVPSYMNGAFSKHPREFLQNLKEFITWFREKFLFVPATDSTPPMLLNNPAALITLINLITNAKPISFNHRGRYRELIALCFAACLRTLELRVRLVASLKPVPLSLAKELNESTTTTSGGKKSKSTKESTSTSTSTTTSTTKKSKSKSSPAKQKQYEPDPYPFKFWVEVMNPNNNEWVCIDPDTGVINKPHNMDLLEKPGTPDEIYWGRPLTYAIAMEKRNHAFDVTKRYSSQWSRTSKLRLDDETWFKILLRVYQPSDSTRERTFLDSRIESETMPTTISGLKEHKLYVLERHLKKNEIIWPRDAPVAGHIGKGERVYKRENVRALFRKEHWLKKEGKVPKIGENPLKVVKAHAVTINKKRAIEIKRSMYTDAASDDEEIGLETGEMVGLFAEWQVENYRHAPIVDGKIPKGAYGNIDLFHPNLLPPGCVHVDLPGIAKSA